MKRIQEEYDLKIKPLTQKIENLKEERDRNAEEVQRPRIETEKKLMNELGRMIHIGNPLGSDAFKYRLADEYMGNLTFGFNLEDAIKLLKIAIKNKVDVDRFLKFCEFARRSLEYCWEKSSSYNITRQKESLFPPSDIETLPDLRQVDELSNLGLDILFSVFVSYAPQRGNISQARELFIKAKEVWGKVDDSRIDPEYSRALSCFFDFLVSEQVEILEEPTSRKFHYDFFSLKLK